MARGSYQEEDFNWTANTEFDERIGSATKQSGKIESFCNSIMFENKGDVAVTIGRLYVIEPNDPPLIINQVRPDIIDVTVYNFKFAAALPAQSQLLRISRILLSKISTQE